MMKKYQIGGILFISLLFVCNRAYAKYLYEFNETIIQLTRDSQPPICEVRYSEEKWTNQNVILTITANEEIEQVSGFTLSEDKKVLSKEISENESDVITIRDWSGNCTEVEYDVSNIDKQPPQIIGCQDGGVYHSPLELDYMDNVEVEEVKIEPYGEHLRLGFHDTYYDSAHYFGIDKSDTTLKVEVIQQPVGTIKYRYYLNDQLYTTLTDKEYIFTGLEKGTSYQIKVEALDKNGKILQTTTRQERTTYFEKMTSYKTLQGFSAQFHKLDCTVAQIKYAVWNYYDNSKTRWYDSQIIDQCADIKISNFNKMYSPSYVVHIYMYDMEGNILDLIPCSIDLQTSYTNRENKISEGQLIEQGNYQIIATDLAGNETIYYIKVE